MATATDTLQAPVGYAELVRSNRNFRNLWFGQIISLLGDWFNLIGSAALIFQLSGSNLAVGGLFVVRSLAPFLISPLAGVATDRVNRKHLLVVTDLVRAVTVLGFLLVREPRHVWLLYALTAVQLAIGGVFFPARNAILPNITSPRELGAANALSATTWSVMLALGAALGGFAAGLWGIYPAFVIDSATYLVSAVFLSRVQYHWTAPDEIEGNALRSAVQLYFIGLRYLRQHKDVLVVALQKTALSIAVWGPLQVVQVLLSQQLFVMGEGGSTSLGIMFAATGIGTGVGPILARRYTGDRPRYLRLALIVAYAFGVVAYLLTASLLNFPVVVAGMMLQGAAIGIIWVFSTQLLMQLVPDRVRGRVFATEFAMMTLAGAAANAAGGLVLDRTDLGVPGVMLISMSLTFVAGLLWLWWMRRHEAEPAPRVATVGDVQANLEEPVAPPAGPGAGGLHPGE